MKAVRIGLNVLLIGAILLGIYYLLTLAGCFKKQPPVIPVGIIDTLHTVNKAGDSVISLKGHEQDFAVIAERIKDSIAEVYSAKEKDLREIIIAQTRTITHLQSSGPTEVTYKPEKPGERNPDCPPEIATVQKYFANPYYKSDVFINLENDSLSYNKITGYDTITGVWKTVKEGNFFNRKKYLQLDVSLANPDTKITGLMAYRMPDPKPKKFGVGPSAGVMYDGKFKPYVGIGLQFNIIRF